MYEEDARFDMDGALVSGPETNQPIRSRESLNSPAFTRVRQQEAVTVSSNRAVQRVARGQCGQGISIVRGGRVLSDHKIGSSSVPG